MSALAYLTVEEAAERLAVTPQAVRLRVHRDVLPCVMVGRACRIEARALEPSAPDPIPTEPQLSVRELAVWWRVSLQTIRRLVWAGQLAARRDGGTLYVRRREVLRFLLDHGRGEDR